MGMNPEYCYCAVFVSATPWYIGPVAGIVEAYMCSLRWGRSKWRTCRHGCNFEYRAATGCKHSMFPGCHPDNKSR